MMIRLIAAFSILLVAACSDDGGAGNDLAATNEAVEEVSDSEPANQAAPLEPFDPPQPGDAGGLPDDRAPVSEAPFTPESAQGAANVLQTYYALIEEGDYDAAWALRSPGADGPSREAFAASFDRYAEYHAKIGAPSDIQGAAGSLYIEVPVQIYGRMKDGKPFSSAGTVTLRRSNNIPGSTAEQRRWRIYTSG